MTTHEQRIVETELDYNARMAAVMQGHSEALRPKIWVLKVTQPDLPDLMVDRGGLEEALTPDGILGFCVDMALDGDYEANSELLTITVMLMTAEKFYALPEWEA